MNEKREFDAKGNLVQHWEEIDGLKHGVWRIWSEAGALIFEGNFVAGKPHGESRKWNEDGLLVEVSNYDHGVLHGHFWSCWSNGQDKEVGEFVRGERVTPFIWSDRNGGIIQRL